MSDKMGNMNGFDDRTQTIEMMGRVITYEAALNIVRAGMDPIAANAPLSEDQKTRWITRLTTHR